MKASNSIIKSESSPVEKEQVKEKVTATPSPKKANNPVNILITF
jgi:hypothetical protein